MKRAIALIGGGLFAASTMAQPALPPPGGYGAPIAIADAMALVEHGVRQSEARGHAMAIAVVEPSGELVAFARMDGAPYASARLAQQKARTAARLRVTTANLEQRVLEGRSVLLSSDEVIAIAGGVPIVVDGRVIGAVGVSGASAAEDAAIAEAMLASR